MCLEVILKIRPGLSDRVARTSGGAGNIEVRERRAKRQRERLPPSSLHTSSTKARILNRVHPSGRRTDLHT